MRTAPVVGIAIALCTGVSVALTLQPARMPEATSLLGRPLFAPEQPSETRVKAEAGFRRTPDDPDAAIWLGRRKAYLGRFRDAIDVFSKAVEAHPGDARMYRHRGHRYITVRELDRAIADLSRAAQLVEGKADQIEPDGQPNARNIPTSTLNGNIYYHLGLAHYLKGEFDTALRAYRRCMEYSKNPDMLAATSHWLYMTLRRLQRADEANRVLAAITPDMEIIENASYHKLLLMYKGAQTPEALLADSGASGVDAVTIGYGVGNWYLYNGRRAAAMAVFRGVVQERESQWPAFGYIAAEAELSPSRSRTLLR